MSAVAAHVAGCPPGRRGVGAEHRPLPTCRVGRDPGTAHPAAFVSHAVCPKPETPPPSLPPALREDGRRGPLRTHDRRLGLATKIPQMCVTEGPLPSCSADVNGVNLIETHSRIRSQSCNLRCAYIVLLRSGSRPGDSRGCGPAEEGTALCGHNGTTALGVTQRKHKAGTRLILKPRSLHTAPLGHWLSTGGGHGSPGRPAVSGDTCGSQPGGATWHPAAQSRRRVKRPWAPA